MKAIPPGVFQAQNSGIGPRRAASPPWSIVLSLSLFSFASPVAHDVCGLSSPRSGQNTTLVLQPDDSCVAGAPTISDHLTPKVFHKRFTRYTRALKIVPASSGHEGNADTPSVVTRLFSRVLRSGRFPALAYFAFARIARLVLSSRGPFRPAPDGLRAYGTARPDRLRDGTGPGKRMVDAAAGSFGCLYGGVRSNPKSGPETHRLFDRSRRY